LDTLRKYQHADLSVSPVQLMRLSPNTISIKVTKNKAKYNLYPEHFSLGALRYKVAGSIPDGVIGIFH